MDESTYWNIILNNPFWTPKADHNHKETIEVLKNPLFHSMDPILFELGWYYLLQKDISKAYVYWSRSQSWKCIEAIATYILNDKIIKCQFYIRALILLEAEIFNFPALQICFKQIQEICKRTYESMEFEEQGELIRHSNSEILEKYMHINLF